MHDIDYEKVFDYVQLEIKYIDPKKRKKNKLYHTLINNHVYGLIETKQITEAKKYINELNSFITDNNPIILATLGLLDIVSGKIDKGKKKYEYAIKTIKDKRQRKDLIKKMHLEIGKALIKIKDYKHAKYDLIKGLKINSENECFDHQIRELLDELNMCT